MCPVSASIASAFEVHSAVVLALFGSYGMQMDILRLSDPQWNDIYMQVMEFGRRVSVMLLQEQRDTS
jgi:hypothetical protein